MRKILAIVIARPVMDCKQALDSYAFDYEGGYLYIDCSWCPNNLKLITLALLKRFGSKKQICWHRWRGSTRLRKAKAEKLLTLILPE